MNERRAGPDSGGPGHRAAGLAVCVPTMERPDALRTLLESLLEQRRCPDLVLVVDASRSSSTRVVCEQMAPRFPKESLRYEKSSPGLPSQRRVCIDQIRRAPFVRYLCFLDDDVTLEPSFLSTILAFLESEDGRTFGGVCGYDLANWDRPFERLEVAYQRLGLFGGELRPGRWTYCGHFLELTHMPPSDDVVKCDFLLGGLTVWRTEVFDRFLPPIDLKGYALGEDKHFSLRVGTLFDLGVHCGARAWHRPAKGGRPSRLRIAYQFTRMQGLLLRDCDRSPTFRRYVSFLGFQGVNALVHLVVNVVRGRFRDLSDVAGWLLGWMTCIVFPPRRTRDSLRCVPSARVLTATSADDARATGG